VNRPHSTKGLFMTIAKLVLMLVCLMSVTLETQRRESDAAVVEDLTDFPGKEGLRSRLSIHRARRTQYIATTHMRLFMCLRAQS